MSGFSSPVFKYWPELNLSPYAQMERFFESFLSPLPVPPYLLRPYQPYRSNHSAEAMPDYSSMAEPVVAQSPLTMMSMSPLPPNKVIPSVSLNREPMGVTAIDFLRTQPGLSEKTLTNVGRMSLEDFSRLAPEAQEDYLSLLRHATNFELFDLFGNELKGLGGGRMALTLEDIETRILQPYFDIMRTGLPFSDQGQ